MTPVPPARFTIGWSAQGSESAVKMEESVVKDGMFPSCRKECCRKLSPAWVLMFVLLMPWAGPSPAAVEGARDDAGVIGHATYYARRFAGRPTASGEIYNHDKLTAAHTDLPFGTRVRVISLANGREVTVTVNDRCRPRTVPFIDLSRAAARAIGLLGKGTTRVRIIPEPPAETSPVSLAEAEISSEAGPSLREPAGGE
jgi:rare lipoprotein A